MDKVILILADGMRPDSLAACGNPECAKFASEGASCMTTRTVMPSVTLPCHMSLFLSVDPQRHGILTNTYVPQVRPVKGLVEKLTEAGKKCAFFYDWGELRDLVRPGYLAESLLTDGHAYGFNEADEINTARALDRVAARDLDFIFLYLGDPDEVGHRYGWMGAEYLSSVNRAWDRVRRVADAAGDDYTVIVTADHGGHERSHGTDMPCDMTIPILMRGPGIAPSSTLETASILDLAPTIAHRLAVESDRDWEGRALV